VPKEEVIKRVRAAAAAVHIEALLDKLPRQCSGGESQRVALALPYTSRTHRSTPAATMPALPKMDLQRAAV
jgi:ABC-type sugar transport system ATPase subunit